MNFSTHKAKLLEGIEIALSKDKSRIVADFKHILGVASSLLPEHDFSFWLHQLGETELAEIPMTKYGLEEARRNLERSGNLDRSRLAQLLLSLCEQLFSYSKSDDTCEMQSDYHYYFHIPTRTLFKESKSGNVVPNVKVENRAEIRIAWVSEIDPGDGELVSS